MRRVNRLLSNVEVVMRTVSQVLLNGLLLSGLAILAANPATAADFDFDAAPRYDAPYAPPPPLPPAPTYNAPYAPPPAYEPPRVHGGYYPPPPPRPVAAEECRSYLKSRVDEWGREVQRRVRVCEDVVGAPRHAPAYAPPHTPAYAPPYAPSPYAAAPAPVGVYLGDPYDGAPRPPADVGVNYYYR
jgi:hypothetical protein